MILSIEGFAQKETKILSNKKEIGYNLLTKESIHATELTFPNRIHDFQFDSIDNSFTIKLRGLSKNGKWLDNKGSVIKYSFKENKILWSKKIAFQTEDIVQIGGLTLHITGRKSYCLDNKTGLKKWEVKNSIIFADAVKKIGIGYKAQASKKKENLLECINLENGQVIWQRNIKRDYGWNNVSYINDSTLLICASGLHAVSIYNGIGWDYNTITGKKDYTASVVGSGLGVVVGLLTGTYAVSTGHNLVRDVVSNIIIDSSSIYFASKEYIVKLNKNGNVIWKTPLPKDLTSKSLIFKNDNSIVMVNRGYAYMGYRQLDFGKPFIASFEITNGNQNYLSSISNKKKNVIKAIDKNDSILHLIFEDHISKYLINSGALVIDKLFNTKEIGGLKYFISNQAFILKDSVFTSLQKLDSLKNYLYTSNGKVLILNNNLETVSEIEQGKLYINYLSIDDKKFLAKGSQTYIVDNTGNVRVEFKSSSKSTIINNKLYSVQEREIIEIDIETLINLNHNN